MESKPPSEHHVTLPEVPKLPVSGTVDFGTSSVVSTTLLYVAGATFLLLVMLAMTMWYFPGNGEKVRRQAEKLARQEAQITSLKKDVEGLMFQLEIARRACPPAPQQPVQVQ
ncbi:MAG: hypothetical protein ACKO7W_04735 [Elainella sp.]